MSVSGFLLLTFAVATIVVLAVHLAIETNESSDSVDVGPGTNLPVAAIGDPTVGEELFDSKRCSDCHAYAGQGGEDVPPLDFMRGRLTGNDIAGMSGVIWNHVPLMVDHFEEEEIPFPTFSNTEMADLIAYLHGGPPNEP